MAITETSICNSALVKIGALTISSLSDTSRQAELCNEQYSKCRDEVLIQHPWNFALVRVSLAEDATTPVWGYDRRFVLPADCLRVFQLEDPDMQYKVEGRYILTNEATPLNVLYIKKVTDTSQFTPIFAEALSARLAADLAYSLENSAPLQAAMMSAFQSQLRLARTMDAQEGTPDEISATTWVTSRY